MSRGTTAAAALAVLMSLASGARAETTSGLLVVGPGDTLVIGPGVERHHFGPIVVSGGRVEVNGGKLFLTGSMTITKEGAVVSDAGELHLQGNDTHVLVGGFQPGDDSSGSLVFRNGGRYHLAQTYASQHELQARKSKLDVDDRTQAALLALRTGLADTGRRPS